MKHLITLFFILFSISTSFGVTKELKRDSIMTFASTLKGVPYFYGGANKKGFDCSGFVYYVFKKFNVSVPRTSASYNKYGEKRKIKDCQPADVIVFTGTNSSIRKPGHIGLVLRNNNGVIDFIHASSSKRHFGVTITRYNLSGYEKRFLHVTSVLL